MNVVLVGLNHKTAPIEVRERIAFGEGHLPDALSSLVDHESLDEALIVSTCNRVELLASAPTDPDRGLHQMTAFLCDFHKLQAAAINEHLYRHSGPNAVRHIFRVASSLDSMVVGEPQILGQVKEAYQHAIKAGTIGRVLSQLMNRTLSVAKRVRNETAVSQSAVTVSSVAVELGLKIFGDLSNKSVLLVGAGEMAELAAASLIGAGASHLTVVNRTVERAEAIAAKFGGESIDFDRLYQGLADADVLICSTLAPDYVLTLDGVTRALKTRKKGPIVLIDISVPRNVDPAIASLPNCFVFDVDDLQSVVSSNLKERQKEAAAAELIIDAEVEHFLGHLRSLDIGPSILELKQVLYDIAHAELKRNRKHLGSLTSEQEAAIKDILLPALVNKLSHPIILHMRTASKNGERSKVLDELRKMIRID
ncbi:MAG TPA: glutamyl-tRNA reductase [Blastocatellia bacterium]